ncbi:hypothetical protein GQ671_09825 [Salinicoccus hispanicus]|uniref:Aminotransferase class I/II-fold pyridoxal phosphate-dependent enzyme n=2 Tax=Salinicoccus hispanicus TaxID=157225 RepID=A0A6N8U1C0_9STAP|nr:hypothetical protein [Salinicoccus hispanicus]MXQ51562.1 hypothetical protein [Salinicoccus hispanicus]
MELYRKVTGMIDEGSISMHVPGHKNNTIGSLSSIDWRYDMTEIEGLDDLHEPSGVLQRLNDQIGMKYKGYTAQMMVNGTTNGILATIYALAKSHRRFIVVEGAHKSIYHALELADTVHETIALAECTSFSFQVDDVMVITYPTYTGGCFDIGSIIEHVHSRGGLVVTDEAHGAHCDIAEGFPPSSMNYQSDVTIQSYHKMLPALTMASVIFLRDEILHKKIMKYIDYFETSSPSYLIMMSIEQAHAFYNDYQSEVFFEKRKMLIEALNERGIEAGAQDDPAKLMLVHPDITSLSLAESFIAQNIYPEMWSDEGVLFCLPLFHEGDRYPFQSLLSRINVMDFNESTSSINESSVDFLENRICIQSIVPYPPGVPLVHEGEKITSEHIKSITHYLHNRVRIEGIKSNIQHYKNEDDQ